ncbi:DUF1302 domain-containing protein [Pseudomonas sp. MH9.2]|uniref:DUF1302 domain-containing protein n=1 Tax=unclassified Pseudomonas TaxID=196821 RepID=UPI002AC9EE78|nr:MULTISPECIES: DUF1302 domain-containing protein [unclassified Pseudomonas]MEB0028798.1 DUF1302 domain-containing protein [Pseudomonas sp. MH9.2]MEB0150250.1 DUF1302 domain-containing protein [Pseudomonas sp. CCC2.2]MEE3507474.1 DUF1302 domain-containing protein [Pseudomonas sp. 10C3]WPX68851.1 DUF1302 domain-containing protein [Pseudomonas sp. MH9.2]
MTTTIRPDTFPTRTLAIAIAVGMTAPAYAVSFDMGDIQGQFDSSLSLGASRGTSAINKSLVGINNGGKAFSATGDDGRLNFKRGDAFSKIFKGIHDLELKYGDTGVFVRGKYWYDFELEDGDRDFKSISNDHRDEGAKSSGGEILDAFVYHNYSITDLPGSVRAGKQVVSWGESTFIGNSINSINPIDVSAFRRPGAEIKEGLIPVNMLYLSQGVTDKLSVEGFYQLNWEKTVLDNCGTFFSSTDVAARGCNANNRVGSPAIAPLEPIANAVGLGFNVNSEGVEIPRGSDNDPRNAGQFGLVLRWQGDNTEYDAYYMNYHSRTPFISTRTASGVLAKAGALASGVCASQLLPANCLTNPGIPAAARAQLASATSSLLQSATLGNDSYFLEYPEDIHLYGLSFATTLPEGTAWSGEFSYRPNAPLQINPTDMTRATLNPLTGGTASPVASTEGAYNRGYNRKQIYQAQTTFTHFFDQVMGAERFTLVGEAAFTYVGGLESTDKMRYGRDPAYGSPDDPTQLAEYGTSGFVTASSWGYRMRGIWDYNNVFAGINLKPNVSWSQDVHGYGPNGLFNQGAKALSFGVDADYKNTYTANLSYTDFSGGEYNSLIDRDFLSLSFGVNF